MPEKQVKSRRRVAAHGEVFTAEREVKAMCDLVKQETERIDSRFLEKNLSTLIQRPVSFESGLNWFQPNKAFESGFTFPQ